MSSNPDDYQLEPNLWFNKKVSYEGRGTAIFENPTAKVFGLTTVDFDERGVPTKIVMEITKLDADIYIDSKDSIKDTLYWVLTGRKPFSDINSATKTYDIQFDNNTNTCSSLTIETHDGIYKAIEKIQYQSIVFDNRIKFYISTSEFKVKSNVTAKYWVFPLVNFVSDNLERVYFPFIRHILDKHPLRISPPKSVPEDLPQDKQWIALNNSNIANRFIPFRFNKNLGFIEAVKNYKQLAQQFKEGGINYAITSIMVGDCDNNSIAFDNIEQWMPIDYIHMLSLASGSLVGLPWIEFRDEQCNLVKRIHCSYWISTYFRGHNAIDKNSKDGIGFLLSNAPQKLLPETITAIRSLVRGGNRSKNIEERFVHLFQAADTLSKDLRHEYSISTKVFLEPDINEEIRSLIKKTGQEINKIATSFSDETRIEIERIAKVVFGAMNQAPKRPDEAKAFLQLAKRWKLNDVDVILDIEVWIKLFNKYRNRVIHDGYFVSDENLISEYIPLYIHLCDL